MCLSEWREFSSANYLAGEKKSWWQLASRCCWNCASLLTFFLSASATRNELQFGSWTDPSFQRHYRFRPTTLGIRTYQHTLVLNITADYCLQLHSSGTSTFGAVRNSHFIPKDTTLHHHRCTNMNCHKPTFTVLSVTDTRTAFNWCCSFNWKRRTDGNLDWASSPQQSTHVIC